MSGRGIAHPQPAVHVIEHRVGEVLPCMEIAQRGDPWFMLEAHEDCRSLASCIWGFEALQLPNDQAKAYLDAE